MPTYGNAKSESKLIYEELSYKINGILFSARRELGGYCNEKQYCDAIEEKFKKAGIGYEREKILPASFEGERNRNRVDFLIEGKMVLEVKAKRFISKEEYYQLKRYLSVLNKKLGILVNFRQKFVHPKRVLNASADE
ncbi:MAG: hypothetical protein UV40_C0025G0006 [Parcubacteria group bacterium GW2011_GWA1_42_7]|nr:MAG: hypothetical protein UV34_C0007G0011 [Parcubacteria group bacterium GW2011_GWB1_42_6]KKS69368.1 MAG: hypothetical protein UV40_C0025G0006 [Parcubacteria group bacterium GW2011_GWA1_42_7]KKS92114.1 MAG: hypothetical protein UV67_C0010G0019 [Parcubacteria group bacterium GW2011_GWC1_43_12]